MKRIFINIVDFEVVLVRDKEAYGRTDKLYHTMRTEKE